MTGETSEPSSELQFARAKKWTILLLSMAITVPCFWHRRIEAGDLGSHVYNAWLAQLIEKGQAQGLYLARQWNNVLFDWLMLHAANLFGFAAAEKIVVSLCVLIFFWGVFALLAAVSERPPWFLAPCVAMLAYGYSFNMGFLNYYLSLGLASFSIALLWRGRGLERFLGLLIVPFILFAHPIGFLWLAGMAFYIFLWTKLPKVWKLCAPASAIVTLLAIHWYLAYQTKFPVDWEHSPFYVMNGVDQLTLYGQRYAVLGWIALGFGVLCVLVDLVSRWRDTSFWQSLR